MSESEQRLRELGFTLPSPIVPAGVYVPFVRSGNQLFIAGQLCYGPDGVVAPQHIGKLGDTLSMERGMEAAQLCALNVLSQVKLALGDLDRVVRCIRLGGFINADPAFDQVSLVMNAASKLIIDVFGERGKHVRTTVGCTLPRNAAAEVEATFEVA